MKHTIKSFLGKPVRFLSRSRHRESMPSLEEALTWQADIVAKVDPKVFAAGRTMLEAEIHGDSFGHALGNAKPSRLIFTDLADSG